jgi:hypothetical protein
MEAQPILPQKKTNLKTILIIVGAIIVIGGALGGYFWNKSRQEYIHKGPCGIDLVNAANSEMSDIFVRWTDADNLAKSTPRVGLAAQIQTLQQIKRDSQKITVPTCLQNARDELGQGMDNAINAYIAFMGQEDDAVVNQNFTFATNNLKNYSTEIDRVMACAPDCK